MAFETGPTDDWNVRSAALLASWGDTQSMNESRITIRKAPTNHALFDQPIGRTLRHSKHLCSPDPLAGSIARSSCQKCICRWNPSRLGHSLSPPRWPWVDFAVPGPEISQKQRSGASATNRGKLLRLQMNGHMGQCFFQGPWEIV